MLRLRAQITIDIEASDFVAAADHQRQVEDFIAKIREVYEEADLVLKERRAPIAAASPRPPARSRKHTGALNAYQEL
jgi:hypothetical protein